MVRERERVKSGVLDRRARYTLFIVPYQSGWRRFLLGRRRVIDLQLAPTTRHLRPGLPYLSPGKTACPPCSTIRNGDREDMSDLTLSLAGRCSPRPGIGHFRARLTMHIDRARPDRTNGSRAGPPRGPRVVIVGKRAEQDFARPPVDKKRRKMYLVRPFSGCFIRMVQNSVWFLEREGCDYRFGIARCWYRPVIRRVHIRDDQRKPLRALRMRHILHVIPRPMGEKRGRDHATHKNCAVRYGALKPPPHDAAREEREQVWTSRLQPRQGRTCQNFPATDQRLRSGSVTYRRGGSSSTFGRRAQSLPCVIEPIAATDTMPKSRSAIRSRAR